MLKKLPYLALGLAFIPVILGLANWPVQASVEIGSPVPNFIATDINGEEFNLEKNRGS